MAVYFVTGKLGAGKSLVTVGKIRDYLSEGRRVATNLDLWLDEMFTYHDASVTRLPDKPRPEDMENLGSGYEHEDPRHNDESRYGLIVLDECGTWLNTREWNDKERRKLIDWFRHARKHRWDIMFLIQDLDSCDKQIVGALCEHLVVCRRLDKFKLLGMRLPRVHIANVYYGSTTETRVEAWTYRGTDLFKAYDTRQLFRDGVEFYDSGPVDMRASYTMLSAHHLKGRYLPKPPEDVPLLRRLGRFLLSLTVLPVALVWMLVHPSSCTRSLYRRQWLDQHAQRVREKREARLELLRLSLDPNRYPGVEVMK